MLAAVLLGSGGAAWAQSAVCSNTPDSNQRISCTEGTSSTSDVDLDLDDVDISTTARNVSGIGVRVNHRGTGEIDVTFRDGSITTSGDSAMGIEIWHRGTGGVDLDVGSSLITTKGEGDGTHGIYGRSKNGIVNIKVRDSDVLTSGQQSHGIHTIKIRETGNMYIGVTGGSVATSGNGAYAVYADHSGTGDIMISTEGSSIETSGGSEVVYFPGTSFEETYVIPSEAIFGWHQGTGDIDIGVAGGSVTASGSGASGINALYWGTGNAGNIDIDVRDASITSARHGILARNLLATGNVDIRVAGGSITASSGYGIWGYILPAGDLDIDVRDGTAIRSEENTGIYGQLDGVGDLGIQVVGSSITAALRAIYGQHRNAGALDIDVRDSTLVSENHGIYGWHRGAFAGDLGIRVVGGSITVSDDSAYGIYGRHSGTGNLDISVTGGSVTTSGAGAHGIHARHEGTGSIAVELRDATVHASGTDAHGVQVGYLDADGVVQGVAGFDADGYRQQTVTVNSEARGGSGDGAGIFLAGGGRVVVGPHGRVGADSGIAVRAAGRGPDGQPGPLSVDLTLNARPLQEVLGDGRIVNDDGPTELTVNGVMLSDSATGATDMWAPNGAWDVTARAAEDGIETVQVYAPRAALYESLPGLLLRLDAGAPVQRPEEPAWAQVGYGAGSGEAQRSQTGASYDFDRIEARAGTSRAWGDFGGSVWLRHMQSEVKVDSPSGPGELELHGAGAGVTAHWRGAGNLEISGEVSLTDFDVDADSVRHGRLARDVGAELWQVRLAAGYHLEQANGLTLLPRAWAWHAEADLDDFTDATGARVRYADESRTAVGLGLRAELAQAESLLHGSLDVEHVFEGEETAVGVSGHRLASESEKTRVWVGMGGQLWRGEHVTLRGGLRLGDPGGRNQEVSASLSLGGRF